MGLDMYIHTVEPEGAEPTEIFYWRKFNPLHGWFEQHHQIGNCENLVLTTETLDQIEEDAKEGKLVTTEGFFYGGEWTQEEILEELKPGLEAARKAIADGSQIAYWAWW